MDGIRGYWNGYHLVSRHSKQYHYPSWFIAELPKGIPLDGEIWIGRQMFENTVALLNSSHPSHPLWKKLKYMVFDLPIENLAYESRIERLKQMNLPSHVIIVESKQCQGNHQLLEALTTILTQGGELILMGEGLDCIASFGISV